MIARRDFPVSRYRRFEEPGAHRLRALLSFSIKDEQWNLIGHLRINPQDTTPLLFPNFTRRDARPLERRDNLVNVDRLQP